MCLENWPLLEASCISREGCVEGFVEGVAECVAEWFEGVFEGFVDGLIEGVVQGFVEGLVEGFVLLSQTPTARPACGNEQVDHLFQSIPVYIPRPCLEDLIL